MYRVHSLTQTLNCKNTAAGADLGCGYAPEFDDGDDDDDDGFKMMTTMIICVCVRTLDLVGFLFYKVIFALVS